MGLREDYRRHQGRTQGGFQGKEFTTNFQANTEEELDGMIREAQGYSDKIGTGSVETIRKKRDPDGGWEAIVRAHNWNPLKWVKEKFAEPEEEKEFKERRRRGEVPVEELSPRERREQVEAVRAGAEAGAKAAGRARQEEFKRAPKVAREVIEAAEEARQAEERAKVLETGLYGAPLIAPVEIIKDRWGRVIKEVPLTAKRREEAVTLEIAQQKITARGLKLIEERYRTAEEEAKEKRVKKRRGRILGPAGEIVKGVAGTVEAVGKGVGGIGFSPEPYRMKPPSVLPTPRSARPARTPVTGLGTTPQAPDLSHFREMGIPKVGKPSKSKGRNTYNDSMKRMRKLLFGG